MDSTMVAYRRNVWGGVTCKLRVTFSVESINYDGKNSLNLVLDLNRGLHRHCNATMFSFEDDGSMVLMHHRPGLDVDDFVQLTVQYLDHRFADFGVALFLVVHIQQFLHTIVEGLTDAGEVTDVLLRVDAHIEVPPLFDPLLLDESDIDDDDDSDDDVEEEEDGNERLGEAPRPKELNEKILETKKVEDGYVNDGCSVCMEEMRGGEFVAGMLCKHWFHDGCIRRWLDRSKSCPLCRYKPAV